MKRLRFKPGIVILMAIILLWSGTNGFAAQKRAVDTLKYPGLNPFKLPEISKSELPNGIKLRLIKNDKLPLVRVAILIKGGNLYDPSSKVGISDIITQLLRIGGVKDLTGDELDKLLDSKGISINANAGNEYLTVSLNCLKDNLETGVSFLSKILKEPVFNEGKLEEIKTKLASEISRRNDQVGSVLSREFNKLIYGAGSPFAATQEYESLDDISREDVVNIYKRFITPDNMLVGIAGPFEINEIKQLFEKYFGDWNTKATIPPFPEAKEQTHDFKVAFAQKSDINQCYVSVGHLGIKMNPDEEARITVFNSIFSQSFDARLMSRIRIKMGLTYGVSGGIITRNLYAGKTFFTTYTKSESTIDVIKAIFEEIDRIRKEKVSEKELSDAKNYFLNSYVFNFSTPESILFTQLMNEFYGLPGDHEKKLLEDIKKVTADDILEIAQKYLTPEKMIIAVVGDEKLLIGDLSQFGKLKKLDISIKPPALKEKILPATPETLAKGKKIIDSLFEKNYKGYKLLKSLEMLNDMNITMQGRTLPMSVKIVRVLPDKMISEMSLMGMKMERIINGKKGIAKQMGKEKPLTGEDIEKSVFGELSDIFSSKGKYNYQYLKEEMIDGKKYDVIYVFDAKENWIKFFVNTQTQLIEIEEKLSDFPGMSGVMRSLLLDIKTVEGIPFPYKTESYLKNEKVMEIVVKDIKVNQNIDPTIFQIDKKN